MAPTPRTLLYRNLGALGFVFCCRAWLWRWSRWVFHLRDSVRPACNTSLAGQVNWVKRAQLACSVSTLSYELAFRLGVSWRRGILKFLWFYCFKEAPCWMSLFWKLRILGCRLHLPMSSLMVPPRSVCFAVWRAMAAEKFRACLNLQAVFEYRRKTYTQRAGLSRWDFWLTLWRTSWKSCLL